LPKEASIKTNRSIKQMKLKEAKNGCQKISIKTRNALNDKLCDANK
jgi:hypothetical protein